MLVASATKHGSGCALMFDVDLVRAFIRTQRERLHLRYVITLNDGDYTRNFIDADEVDTILADILRFIDKDPS